MLLSNIKIKYQTSKIVAMDWANGGFEVVSFDPRTLQIKS